MQEKRLSDRMDVLHDAIDSSIYNAAKSGEEANKSVNMNNGKTECYYRDIKHRVNC